MYFPGSSGRAFADRIALSAAALAIAIASRARASCDARRAHPEPLASRVRAVIENEPKVFRYDARNPALFARTKSFAESSKNPAPLRPACRAAVIATWAVAARDSLVISAKAGSNASGTAA